MKNIIDIFNTIRDIPYRIPILDTDKNECCSGKHKILKSMLESLGIQARYRVCHFKWNESMNLTKELKDVLESDDDTHVYLEVLFDGTWKNVDATWDIGLKNILPVNESWDGVSDTKVAVVQRELFSLEESEKRMTLGSGEAKKNEKFYSVLNHYFEQIRK